MTPEAATLIIFGMSGDLARRKLTPAIAALKKKGQLPQDFHVVGVTRQPGSGYFVMDVANLVEYQRLKEYLATPGDSERLFYLAVPPQAVRVIIAGLGQSNLGNMPRTKVLLEKPFGTDLSSAKRLVEDIERYFTGGQVYLIDHYLAKSIAQNLRALRLQYRNSWGKDSIARIEIIATEEIDIEGRGGFYEATGALRDVIQSHLFELAALALMEVPGKESDLPKARLAALRQLAITGARRGQYMGYREEAASPESTIETFVSVTLASGAARWQGVPIRLTTGKALNEKRTEVRILRRGEDTLVIGDTPAVRPEGYEKVILDAIAGTTESFVTKEEALTVWRLLAPLQAAWEKGAEDLISYPKGSPVEDVIKPFTLS